MTTLTAEPRVRRQQRTSRRGLFRLAGAAAVAAATAAACGGGGSSHAGPAGGTAPRQSAGAGTATATAAQPFPDDRRVRVQHLLRRAGFAPSDSEVRQALQLGDDELVDGLLNPERAPDPGPQPPGASASLKPYELVAWWLGRMAATARPSLEKTTLFWHGWHTSGFDKLGARGTPLLYGQNAYQRENAYGRFGDILKGISRQPAMMIYLDTVTNVKAHANENFARELMELFSMGVGNYTEEDVRQGARAFTGYSLVRQTGRFVFRAGLHDHGTKTYLGQVGDFSGDDIIDIILKQPATAHFAARKAWSFFAHPNPDDATLAPVVKAFTDTGGDMREVLRAVFAHPAFYSGPAYRALVKSPVEYGIGAVRQLGLKPQGVALARWAQAMGQVPFYPPNVAGWPGGGAWTGSGAFLGRLNGVEAMVFGLRGGGSGTTNVDLEPFLEANQVSTAGQLVDRLASLLVDGQLAAGERSAIVDYVSGGQGDATRLDSVDRATRAARVGGTVYLLMASPEYHLA